jgi:hypothetical protein
VAAAKQPVELGKRQRKTVTYNEADLAKAKVSGSSASRGDSSGDSASDASLDVDANPDDSAEGSLEKEQEGGEKKVREAVEPKILDVIVGRSPAPCCACAAAASMSWDPSLSAIV